MKAGLRFTVYGLLILLLSGCNCLKHTVEVPVYIHDTSYVAKEVHDSTYIDHWHTVYQKGDTVFVTETKIKYRERVKIDTAYKYVEKPVVVSQTEIVEVKKPLRWWQKGLMYTGAVCLLCLFGWIVWNTRNLWLPIFRR